MPLSEDEQRILQQIEAQLYESDPALAREVANTTVYSHAFRGLRLSALGFVVGVIIMVATLSISFLFAFGGFLVMLGSALMFVRSVRALGRAGIEQMTQTMRAGGLRDYFGNTSQRMRDRFRNEE